MSNFNYTIQLAQADLDELKNRLAAANLPAGKALAKRGGFKAVGRIPYRRRKYRVVPTYELDRLINREVF